MSSVFKNMTAALLVVWYSLSIVGFDVHTCSGSGETFIATLASGFTCEDIHPDHADMSCSCCSETSESRCSSKKFESDPCCTDEYHVIMLTGVRGDDDDNHYSKIVSSCLLPVSADSRVSDLCNIDLRFIADPKSKTVSSRHTQAVYGVWRI